MTCICRSCCPSIQSTKSAYLIKLEFGDELDFFKKSGATKYAGPIVNAKPTDAYVLKNAQELQLLLPGTARDLPVTLSWQCKDGKYTYEYITYEELPFNPALFSRPPELDSRKCRCRFRRTGLICLSPFRLDSSMQT